MYPYPHPNPFGAWSTSSDVSRTSVPSVFGALPSSGSNAVQQSGGISTFHIMCYSPNIMNCAILDTNSQPHYQITTDSRNPYTSIKNGKDSTIALIEWGQHPLIEVRGTVPKQEIGQWLKLSSDGSSRKMDVKGNRYMWGPKDGFLSLYAGSKDTPVFLARISRTPQSITMEVVPTVIQDGILDVCVIGAFLLLSGLNID